MLDEVGDIVAEANARNEAMAAEGDEEEGSATARRNKPAKKRTNGSKTDEKVEVAPEEKTLEEHDVEKLLERKLPKAAENIKTLGSMYAKYGIGENPEFTVQVWRSYPKIAPGGVKFDGFYDTWQTPISEEMMQSEYGGGTYRIKIVGPHPTKQNLPKHYDSIELQLAGPPKFDRVPRAMQTGGGEEKKEDADMPRMQAPTSQENPKLVETAMKLMQGTAQAEREERRRIEDKFDASRAQAGNAVAPVIESERRRADQLVSMERERREAHEERTRERFEEERQRNAEERRRMETQQGNQRSFGEELASLAPLLQRDDSASREMFKQVLEKHRGEMEGMTTRNTQFIDSIRSGHMSEVSAIRDAHRREVEAEREASRSREARIDERLLAEREERRRDQDRFKEQVEERDRQWRDRMEQSKEVIESSWTSRHQSSIATYEQRIVWLQAEVDRVKSDHDVMKMKNDEKGDVASQMMKLREMQDMIKEFSPQAATAAASSGTGIGISSGGGEDWKGMLAEGVSERLPQIAQALFGGGGAQPQAQPQEGQIIHVDPSTGQPFPHGPMVIVRDPASGQLAMSPKAALDAHQRAVQAGQGGLLQPEQQRRRPPQVMPNPEEVRRRSKVAAVRNFADGMPKLVPPWENQPDELPAADPPQVRPEPRMSTRSRRDPDAPPEPMEMSAQERQGIKIIAKLVHESVMEADEPEEFVAKVMNQYDPKVIRAIVGGYTTDQIARGIRQVEPNSAGATPGGQAFILDAFGQLRRALSE